jgi:type IV pilus assembly protein PilB
MEGDPPSIAPRMQRPEPPPPPAPAPVPAAAPPPAQPPPFQRPNVRASSPQIKKLEGAEVERAVTIDPPMRRRAKAERAPYTALRLLFDLLILCALGIAGYFYFVQSLPLAYGVGGGALLLLIIRLFTGRAKPVEDIPVSMEPTFKKDELHSSAIDLSGIDPEDSNRVQRVARLLGDRGLDETVEVVDLVDDILICAEFLKASDCHIEPKEQDIRISLRIDGVVQDAGVLPKELEQRIANRFRIISKLDFAKVDTPQDGRVEEKIRGRPMNLRVSVFPTAYGPKIVIRLLDSGAHALPPMEKLGIHPTVLKDFKRILAASQGIILFTGPTGSGKTTLMYSGLKEIIDGKVRRNIVTLEDPIERLLPAINQTQVDGRRGLTFAAGLRTILRQDPDVLMVGEIRDSETAEIALRAGQTGHLLLSTLHTNSAAAAFSRLMDMGIEPFLLASAITGVASSRLMRRLCPHCRVQARPPEAFVAQLQGKVRPDAVFYESRGCEECRNTGYAGRMLAFELLTMNRWVADAVMARRSPDEIQKAAVAKGMETILDDGLSKVKSGETSLEEVLRVLM